MLITKKQTNRRTDIKKNPKGFHGPAYISKRQSKKLHTAELKKKKIKK